MTKATSVQRRRWGHAFGWLTASVAVAAVIGWLTMLIAARTLGAADFAGFSVAWAVVFGFGSAFAGLQQEVTRSATKGRERAVAHRSLRVMVAGVLVAFAFTSLVCCVVLWGLADRLRFDALAVAFLALALMGLAMFTIVNGLLTVERDWRLLACLMVADQAVRIVAVSVVLELSADRFVMLAIGSGTLVWLIPVLGKSRVAINQMSSDSSLWLFSARAVAAMTSAISAGVLVTGYPMLVRASQAGDLGSNAGAIFALILVVRSPVLLPLFGLRPVILSWLLERRGGIAPVMARLCAGGIFAATIAAAVGAAVGPPAVRVLFGEDFVVSAPLAAMVAAGSVALGVLTVSGLALVSSSQHGISTAGWVGAVFVSFVMLALPVGLATKVGVSMVAGPLAGIAVHLIAFGLSVKAKGKR